MSSRTSSRQTRSQANGSVFGYIIDPFDGEEPRNPPLLHNDEADILQTFFENPSQLEAGFGNLPNANQNASLGLEDGPYNWDVQNNSQILSGPAASARRNTHTHNLPDDVYSTASFLPDNQNAQDSLNYAQRPPHSGVSGQFTPQNAMVPSQNAANSMTYDDEMQDKGAAEQQQTSLEPSSRENPLRFGSDEHFRKNYQAPPQSAPEIDKTLRDSVQKFWKVLPGEGKAEQRPKQAATASRPKKGQTASSSEAASESSDGADSDDGEDSHGQYPPSKKGKTGDGSAALRAGKRKHSMGQLKSKKASAGAVVSGSGGGGIGAKRSGKDVSSMVKPQRENLTEEQKRSNHIQSEQKRRNLIKQGFEDLNIMVPELRAGGLSKSNMLMEATKFLRGLRDDNEALRAILSG